MEASPTIQCWRSAFHPDSSCEDLASMRKAYLTARREHGERTLALCSEVAPEVTRKALTEALTPLVEMIPEAADAFFLDPVFFAWAQFLRRAVSRRASEEVRFHCNKIDRVIARVKTRLAGQEPHYVPNTSIALQQDNIDEYVMAATPPSYDFAAMLSSGTGVNGCGHPLPMQEELLGFAMDNIEQSWPEMRAQIEDMVQIVGYLPDAAFRSCSAARYAGVVYLGNMDEKVLDVEESLVHETGHQVLYRLGALIPLVKDGTPQTADYNLPWSGSKRDLFGFLHAYYIYTLLTKLFWRRSGLTAREHDDCVQRAILILLGSRIATPTLSRDPNLSDQGRALVEVLAADNAALETEIKATFGTVIERHV